MTKLSRHSVFCCAWNFPLAVCHVITVYSVVKWVYSAVKMCTTKTHSNRAGCTEYRKWEVILVHYGIVVSNEKMAIIGWGEGKFYIKLLCFEILPADSKWQLTIRCNRCFVNKCKKNVQKIVWNEKEESKWGKFTFLKGSDQFEII